MKKLLNTLGYFLIIYGLSFGFTLLQAMLDTTTALAIFVLLPAPYFIAIYLYKGIRELNHDAKQSIIRYIDVMNEQEEEISQKDKQIANYILLDGVRITCIDKLEAEITELKDELSSVAKKEVLKPIKISDKIPFHGDINLIEETWLCPECKQTMTRQTAKTIFCDNINCTRKQWKKAVLSATEVMK